MGSTKSKSITINVILNIIKTLMSVVFPLITFPYAARILHASNLGKVSFAQSIISYFSLIAMLGMNTYAVREGAKLRENNTYFNRFFNEVIRINIVTTFISYVLLFFAVSFIPDLNEYKYLIILMSTSIFFTTVGVEWINVVYEEYLIITVRSIVIQIVNLILLFAFVRTENDYYTYAFLTVFSNILICSWNAFYCRKYIRFQLRGKFDLKKHIKPLLILFANNLSITIYCNVDSTMLGLMLGDYYVGIYAVAIKVYGILKSVFAAIYIVCIPRLSSYIGENNRLAFKELINNMSAILVLILIPAMTGIIVLAKPIVLFLSGAEYIAAVSTVRILGVALIFAIIGGFISNCVIVPRAKETVALKATLVAAIVNVCLNGVLIPVFKHNGAAITTAVAELTVAIFCLVIDKDSRSIFQWNKICVQGFSAVFGCIIVLATSMLASLINLESLLACLFVGIVSTMFYLLFLALTKNYYLNLFLSGIFKQKREENYV